MTRNSDALREAIVRAAQEAGIDPTFALAVAERESSFNPTARSSSTIRGLFQMRGDHRSRYGIGDSDDPYTQAKGWANFIKDERAAASKAAGRDLTDPELYGAHHFGSGRAGRMLRMDPNTPVDQVFTAREMAENPHFARAGTVGRLMSDITSDIGRRQAKFGGGAIDFAHLGEPVEAELPDFSSTAEPVGIQNPATGLSAGQGTGAGPVKSATLPDFSNLGEPVA